MRRPKETAFKDKIRPKLKALKNSHWFKIQQVGLIGTPDFLGVILGQFIALELKRSAQEKLRPMQKYNLDKISLAKGISLVVYPENWQDIFTFLTSLSEGTLDVYAYLRPAARSKVY